MFIFSTLYLLLRCLIVERMTLAAEILMLRQQLAIYQRTEGRPQLRQRDRIFWVVLSRLWQDWRAWLIIVKPDTVIGWHRHGFKFFWTKISQRKSVGRPAVSAEVRSLIKQMAEANPTWGAPRIHGELLKLGIEISERTVSRLMPRQRKPPSQSWRTFLDNHFRELVAIDFFTAAPMPGSPAWNPPCQRPHFACSLC